MRFEGSSSRWSTAALAQSSGQGQVSACAWLLVVGLKETTVAVPGEGECSEAQMAEA